MHVLQCVVQERLYQKAERLASGEYAHKATAVERRRLLHEAELAAKVATLPSSDMQNGLCPFKLQQLPL